MYNKENINKKINSLNLFFFSPQNPKAFFFWVLCVWASYLTSVLFLSPLSLLSNLTLEKDITLRIDCKKTSPHVLADFLFHYKYQRVWGVVFMYPQWSVWHLRNSRKVHTHHIDLPSIFMKKAGQEYNPQSLARMSSNRMVKWSSTVSHSAFNGRVRNTIQMFWFSACDSLQDHASSRACPQWVPKHMLNIVVCLCLHDLNLWEKVAFWVLWGSRNHCLFLCYNTEPDIASWLIQRGMNVVTQLYNIDGSRIAV